MIEYLRLNPCDRADSIFRVLLISLMQSWRRSESRVCKSIKAGYGALIVRTPPERFGIVNCVYFWAGCFLYRINVRACTLKPRRSATSRKDVAAFKLVNRVDIAEWQA